MSDVLDVLQALDLKPFLTGQTVPTYAWGEKLMAAFDPDGRPLGDDTFFSEIGQRQVDAIRREDRSCFLTAELTGDDGEALWINTSYLGQNHNFFGGPPLIWESMVHYRDREFTRRYCTRAAAYQAHELMIQTAEKMGMTMCPRSWPYA